MLGKKGKDKIEEMEEVGVTSEGPSVFEEFESGIEGNGSAKKKKKLPGWVIIPVVAVIIVIALVVAQLSKGGSTATSLEVVKVEKGDVTEIYNTSGTVESDQTKVFYSPVNAPIATCNAKVGMTVKAGDPLILFDTNNLEKNNQESQLNALSTKYTNQGTREQAAKSGEQAAKAQNQTANQIASLKTQIANKEANLNALKNNMDAANQAQQALDQQRTQLSTEIASLNTQITNLEAQNANLEKDNEGLDSSSPEFSNNNMQIKKNNTDLANLKNTLRDKETKLSALGQGGSADTGTMISAAEQEIEGLKTQLQELQNTDTSSDTGLTSGQLNGMAVSENLTELATLTTEELLAKGRDGIKAEFDGVISDMKATQSGEAAQGMELFTLVSNQSVSVKLEVSATDFDKLKIGNKATVKIGQNTYNATLTDIDKIAVKNEKGNPVIGAKVHIDNPDENIYIGVTSKVTITVAEEKKVLNIPSEAVNTSADGEFVYIIQNGTVKKKAVELGVASNSKVEIKDGLKEGDEVVTDTSGTAKEGMKATGQAASGTK